MAHPTHRTRTTLLVVTMMLALPAVARAQDAPDEPLVAGYDKGFFIRAPGAPFSIRTQARLQGRFEAVEDQMAFSIARARLAFDGSAFTDALTYKLQVDLGRGFVTLKDFYADYALVPGALQLRAGQYKRPFSRQQITSSGRLELVDRSITDRAFFTGRDIGIMLHNDYEKSPELEYAFGIFNGTGDRSRFSGDVAVDPTTGEGRVADGRFSNVPRRFHPALALRVGYNFGGIKGYSEADLEGGPLRFGVALGGLLDLDADRDERSGIHGGLDFVVKAFGLSTSGGLFVSSAQSGPSFGDQSVDAIGFHLQAGYMISGIVQPTVRYALVAPEGDDDDLQELLGGVSVYFFDHGLKWQTDGGALIQQIPGGRQTDGLVRTQLQLAF